VLFLLSPSQFFELGRVSILARPGEDGGVIGATFPLGGSGGSGSSHSVPSPEKATGPKCTNTQTNKNTNKVTGGEGGPHKERTTNQGGTGPKELRNF